jgi:hypothetical protein
MSLLSLMLGQPQGGILGQAANIRPQVQQNGLLGRDPWQQMPPGPQLAAGPGFKIPSGYMPDPNNPEGAIVQIPGHKSARYTPEQAAKIQMMRGAQAQLPAMRELLFDPDGSIDKTNVITSRLMKGGVPYTEGQELATMFEAGIQAITRGETGAAMPPEEVENTRQRFQPKGTDSDETAKIKFQMFQDFINGSLKLLDPQGRFKTDTFDSELKTREKNDSGVVNWEDL